MGAENYYYDVIPTRIFRANGGTLTYAGPPNLIIGQIVTIPLGHSACVGIVSSKHQAKPAFPVKPIANVLYADPLPHHLVRAITWLSEYYLAPLPEVATLALPAGIEKVRRGSALRSASARANREDPPKSTQSAPEQLLTNTSCQAKSHSDVSPRNLPLQGSHTNRQKKNRPNTPNTTSPAGKNSQNRRPKNQSSTTNSAGENPESQPSTANKTACISRQLPECLPKNQLKTPRKTRTKSAVNPNFRKITAKMPKIALNPAQKIALRRIQAVAKGTLLLHGVTGSGKTNIYLKMALDAFERQKSSIILVPEIALAPQLVAIFQNLFGSERVFLAHSQLTEAERHLLWERILAKTAGGEPLIVIGPRSALFSPVANLGLIVIDEAHESAYWQENSPRYSAVRLASFIAGQAKIRCLLGTATPLIVDLQLARQKHAVIPLTRHAKPTRPVQVRVVKLGNPSDFSRNRYFADVLISAIKANLKNHRQTLIFHNRRGSAPLTLCTACGWQALCPKCYLPLVLHADGFRLRCHACGHAETVPLACPSCGHPEVVHKGIGTKLLETELKKLFPEAKIARFDSDNLPGESLPALFEQVKNGDFEILIGTQTLARGLDLPNLATVGVAQADAGLFLPDFMAEERTFHLLTQVIGRVGRGHLDTAQAIIQTYQPDHPVIKFVANGDFDGFAAYLTAERRRRHFPPFAHLAEVAVTYKTEKTTLAKIQAVHAELKRAFSGLAVADPALKFSLSAPVPAFHERTARGFTWRITVKASSRTALTSVLAQLPPQFKTKIIIDPPSLI